MLNQLTVEPKNWRKHIPIEVSFSAGAGSAVAETMFENLESNKVYKLLSFSAPITKTTATACWLFHTTQPNTTAGRLRMAAGQATVLIGRTPTVKLLAFPTKHAAEGEAEPYAVYITASERLVLMIAGTAGETIEGIATIHLLEADMELKL